MTSRIPRFLRTPEPSADMMRLIDLVPIVMVFGVMFALWATVGHSQWWFLLVVIGFAGMFWTRRHIPSYVPNSVLKEQYRQRSLNDAEGDFLDASVAVWRQIDAMTAEAGTYLGLDAGTELRKVEKAAWERYRDLLDQAGGKGEIE